MRKFYILLLFTIIVLVAFYRYSKPAINHSATEPQQNANDINQEIIVGTSGDNPLFEFIKNGEVVGIDIDFAYALGQKMNKKIIIKNMDFPSLFPSLEAGNIDMIISGISISEKRAQNFDFSNTYITSDVAAIYIDSSIEINDLGKKVIGAQMGSTWAEFAKQMVSNYEDSHVQLLASNIFLVEELKNKKIDLMILEDVQADAFIKANPEFNIKKVLLPMFSSDFAVVLTKNSKLTKDVNSAILQLLEGGIIEQIEQRWLKSN